MTRRLRHLAGNVGDQINGVRPPWRLRPAHAWSVEGDHLEPLQLRQQRRPRGNVPAQPVDQKDGWPFTVNAQSDSATCDGRVALDVVWKHRAHGAITSAQTKHLLTTELLIRPVREQHQVVELACTIAHEVGQQRLGFETEVLEHRHEGLLLSHYLHVCLTAVERQRFDQGGSSQSAPYPAPTMVGADDHSHLSHVGGPSATGKGAGHSHDFAVRVGSDQASDASVVHCGSEVDLQILEVLLEEAAFTLWHLGGEAREERARHREQGSVRRRGVAAPPRACAWVNPKITTA